MHFMPAFGRQGPGLRVRRQKAIQQRLQRSVGEGELPKNLDLAAVAALRFSLFVTSRRFAVSYNFICF
jgi:hypothetical protein